MNLPNSCSVPTREAPGESHSLPPTTSCKAPPVPLLTLAFMKNYSKSLAPNTPQVFTGCLLDARVCA